ncbi:hypothetical protein [Baekduia sp. Peel2402]|uniref:hypothetical protein n=1 Tax=Baekduia sp. Peel2402 TaxID=3458296 RepID=UPI00403E4E41
MDHKPTPLKDLPVLDVEKLGRTAWDPVMRADGTYAPTPLIYRLFFGIFDKEYRRGGRFGAKRKR